MIIVPTERSNADAPTPQDGVEQTAADQAEDRQQSPPADSGVIDTVSSVVEGVTDVADIIFAIFE
jgi:hypothetical protein